MNMPTRAAPDNNTIAFAMDQWTGAHRAFIIRAYYKNNDSITSAQRIFKRQFSIYQVPPTVTIKSWVRNFECTGSSNAVSSPRRSLPLPTVYCTICNHCLSNEKNFTSPSSNKG